MIERGTTAICQAMIKAPYSDTAALNDPPSLCTTELHVNVKAIDQSLTNEPSSLHTTVLLRQNND